MSDPWAERRRLADRAYLDDPERGEGRESDFVHWVVPHLRASGGREVVEVGCGRGRDAAWLALEGFRVRGVDLSEVAIERAIERQRELTEPARSRLRLVLGEATRQLEGTPPASVDAVLAHVVYATWSAAEIAAYLPAVHRALRPGGLHLFSVRDTDDPRAGQGTPVGRHTYRGGPHAVPYRYYTAPDLDEWTAPRFERVATLHATGDHLFYVADRRRELPPEPPPPARGARA